MVPSSESRFRVLGKTTPRKDGVGKVTGQERYVTDLTLPRMLHGRIVSSPYAHARIKSIDTRAAEAMGAVCLTFADIPDVRYNERIVTVPWALHKDHYVLADKVRRMGEAVAAVAAETAALAEQAARAIRVEYEPLPVLTDPTAAMQPGAAPIYDTVMLGDKEIQIENNTACARDIVEGDPAAAFAQADVIVEGVFRTPKIYHGQMETKSVVCRPESDGGITVWPTTQSIHNVRILLGQIFNIPLSKVNVVRVPIGGTFGSSIQMNSPIPIGVALALKARRPVKLVLTREEDMHEHTNYPVEIHLRLAARADGTLLGAEMDLVTDIGAHIVQGYSFLGVSRGVARVALPAPQPALSRRGGLYQQVPIVRHAGVWQPTGHVRGRVVDGRPGAAAGHGPHRAAAEELRGPGRHVLGPGAAGALGGAERWGGPTAA